ncbi:MAG: phosphoglycerate mutase [Pseudomarimonas sp.]
MTEQSRPSFVPAAPRTLTFLLPARDRLRFNKSLPPLLAGLLARSERLPAGEAGREAQLLRVFDVLPKRISVAPLTRQTDAEDGKYGVWLRADPAHVRADLTMARMLACGELGLSADETEQFISALRPLFGDEGMPISAPTPSRWYLMIPAQSQLPAFEPPEAVLGDDLHAHMPEGDAGRRWRRLLNEAQVILHNHPLNEARAAAGMLPVNSIWFWGAGSLPDHVAAEGLRFASDDLLARSLAGLAGVPLSHPFAGALNQESRPNVIDLVTLRDVAFLESPWLERGIAGLKAKRFDALRLDFADGARREWRYAYRWRWLRRPVRTLA